MINEYQLRVLPNIVAAEQNIKQYISQEKGIAIGAITSVRILKRSIDARQRTVFVNLKVKIFQGISDNSCHSISYGDAKNGNSKRHYKCRIEKAHRCHNSHRNTVINSSRWIIRIRRHHRHTFFKINRSTRRANRWKRRWHHKG